MVFNVYFMHKIHEHTCTCTHTLYGYLLYRMTLLLSLLLESMVEGIRIIIKVEYLGDFNFTIKEKSKIKNQLIFC